MLPNLMKPNQAVVKQGKCFEKRTHQGLQLNEIQSNHPQVTCYEFCKTNGLHMKV